MISENRIRQIIKESIKSVLLEMSPRQLKKLQDFIAQANVVHQNKYDYSKVVYLGTDKNVLITCPIHGDFPQTPHHHLQGQGCPKCLDSHLEKETAKALENLKVKFIDEYPLGTQKLDFYLPEYNAARECQGRQHYEPVWGVQRLEQQKAWDLKKKTNCINQGIRMLCISVLDANR